MTMETLLLENLWKLSDVEAKPQEKHAAQLDVVVIKAVCHVHHTVVVSQENTVIIHSKLIMITIYQRICFKMNMITNQINFNTTEPI